MNRFCRWHVQLQYAADVASALDPLRRILNSSHRRFVDISLFHNAKKRIVYQPMNLPARLKYHSGHKAPHQIVPSLALTQTLVKLWLLISSQGGLRSVEKLITIRLDKVAIYSCQAVGRGQFT